MVFVLLTLWLYSLSRANKVMVNTGPCYWHKEYDFYQASNEKRLRCEIYRQCDCFKIVAKVMLTTLKR